MYRIDHATASASIPAPGPAGAPGYFSSGNPTTGVPATVVTADWLNANQEEIVSVILAAGIPLAKSSNGQLLAAIQSLISGGGTAVTAAGVTIADVGEYFAGTDVEAALQQLATKIYLGTVNSNQVRRSVVALNGAAFLTDATHAENVLEISNTTTVTYTIRADLDYNAPVGTAIEAVQAGAGKVTFVAAVGVIIKKPAVFNARTLGQDATAVLIKTAANTWRLGGMLEAA